MTTHKSSVAAGSHRAGQSSRLRRYGLLLGASLIAIGALGITAGYLALGRGAQGQTTGDGCKEKVTVAADPDIANTVKAILRGAGCEGTQVKARPPGAVLELLAGDSKRPDLWVPDSSVLADQVTGEPELVVDSLARSPVVLVTGRGEPATTWEEAISDVGFVLGDPRSSTPSVTALLAGAEDSTDQIFAMALRAPESDPAQASSASQLKQINDTAGSTVASEKAWLDYAPDLTASVPNPGTSTLDYPLVVTATADRRESIDDTISSIAESLTDDKARELLSKAGFRTGNSTDNPNGVGEVKGADLEPGTVGALRDHWSNLMRPVRGLAVVDVSGSMRFLSQNATRMQLVVASANRLLPVFPDRTSLGVWTFSQADDGLLGSDYRRVLPVRRLDEPVGGSNQRKLVADSLARLESLTGGGTSLYDTSLAAYRAAVRTYDPDAHNIVFLFTDGTNEDPDSISRRELIDGLQTLANPERPVRIIGIGMSQDADADALDEIAEATGGQSFIARQPEDIDSVLRQVMMATS